MSGSDRKKYILSNNTLGNKGQEYGKLYLL